MYAMYFVAVGSLAALLFAASMFAKVKKQPEGNSEMIRISTAVREGANAYLKRQYKGIGIFFAVMFVILLVMAFSGLLGFFTPFAFLTGGFFSGLSGFIGMRTATMANCRTAEGASHSLNRGLKVAFSAGSVMGFTVVGLGLLDITIWYTILNVVFGQGNGKRHFPLLVSGKTEQNLDRMLGSFIHIPIAPFQFGYGSSHIGLVFANLWCKRIAWVIPDVFFI